MSVFVYNLNHAFSFNYSLGVPAFALGSPEALACRWGMQDVCFFCEA